ncbi:hypothetical protein E4P40_00765 [Blastococcus sp. CT_GayMR20]|uniref:Rv1733c family protein n=1 Tax=Blastococcus sp. CT_GayMR20 TaxID=2559609 RepID=UPI0010745EC1|nr:hypothetical protein [Blastococcus sp. CT_GayMR20]TFV92951.1 hypothetical protein E4P40_00765 [Blastococcus sp. CT_GayMR20]
MLQQRSITRRAIRRFIQGSGPSTRTSDRLEFLARFALGGVLLSGVVVALAVATATSTQGRAEVLAETAERHTVMAELLEDASPTDGSEVGRATAVWTGPSGAEDTGTISVAVEAEAGSFHPIWVDPDGNRTTRPLSNGDVAGRSVGFALLTYLGFSLVARGGYRSVRALLDRSRSRQWAAEWAVVEPQWTGRVP